MTKSPVKFVLIALAAAFLMSACNLGSNNAPEPTAITPGTTDTGTTDAGTTDVGTTDVGTTDAGTADGTTPGEGPTDAGNADVSTETDGGGEAPPPTSTPAGEGPVTLAPSEQINSITVVSETFTTNAPVTIQVQRGSAVGSIGCSVTLQDTGETDALTGNTTEQINETTFRETYTYTPSRAGTYTVTCSGLATTASGQQRVSLTSDPFTVEAKG